MTRKQRRFAMIAGGVSVLAAAVLLILFAMKDLVVFFNSPTDVVENMSRREHGSGWADWSLRAA